MEANKPNQLSEKAAVAKPKRAILNKEARKNLGVLLLVLGIFVLIAILSTLAIMIARGERPTRSGIVSSGTIRVTSVPPDVKAYLNDREVQIQDKLITNVTPGTYNLRLTREGFTPWERELNIVAGIVEDVNISLLPAEFELEQVTKSNVQSVAFSDNGEYMFYTVSTASKGEDIGIWRQRINDSGVLNFLNNSLPNKISNLTPTITKAIEAKNYTLIPSRDGQKLLLKIAEEYFVLNASSYNEPGQSNQLDSIIKASLPIQTVDWLRGSDSLLIQTDTVLAELDLASTELILISYKSAQGLPYSAAEGRVLFPATVVDSSSQAGQPGTLTKLFSYSSKRREEVKLENLTIRGEIKQIWSNPQNSSVVVFENTAKEFYYLNTAKSFLRKLTGISTVKQVSRSGNNILVEADGKAAVINIKELPALGTFEVSLNPITIKDQQVQAVRFSATGVNQIIKSASGALYIADADGFNAVQVIDSKAGVAGETYNISSSGSKLFALISEQPGTSKNIYSVGLK
jgi:hypothetical protein